MSVWIELEVDTLLTCAVDIIAEAGQKLIVLNNSVVGVYTEETTAIHATTFIAKSPEPKVIAQRRKRKVYGIKNCPISVLHEILTTIKAFPNNSLQSLRAHNKRIPLGIKAMLAALCRTGYLYRTRNLGNTRATLYTVTPNGETYINDLAKEIAAKKEDKDA